MPSRFLRKKAQLVRAAPAGAQVLTGKEDGPVIDEKGSLRVDCGNCGTTLIKGGSGAAVVMRCGNCGSLNRWPAA